MATLTRPKTAPERTTTTSALLGNVPTPFPVHELERTPEEGQEEPGETRLNEVLPSISTLQKSCVTTLANLLSGQDADGDLQTLVASLRDTEMVQIGSASTTTALLAELRARIAQSVLSPADASLSSSLVTLLSFFDRLAALHIQTPTAATPSRQQQQHLPPPIDMFDALTRHLNDLQLDRRTAADTRSAELDLLWAQIDSELETVDAMCRSRAAASTEHPPQYDDFDQVYLYDDLPSYDATGRPSLDLKHKSDQTTPPLARFATRDVPDEKMRMDLERVARAIDRLYAVAPQLHDQRVELPEAKLARLADLAKRAPSSSEKKKDGTMTPRSRKGKGKEREKDELENLFEMLGKASARTLNDQVVVLEGGVQSRLEKAKAKDRAQRDAFVDQLISHSGAGRMHSQDAVLHSSKVRDPKALLTLPEFIRESIPADSDLLRHPEAMLSLPEFVAQSHADFARREQEVDAQDEIPEGRRSMSGRSWGRSSSRPGSSSGKEKSKSRPTSGHGIRASLSSANPPDSKTVVDDKPAEKKGKGRNRSASAPPRSWLRPFESGKTRASRENVSERASGESAVFDITYVAENHENLQHVLVFFTVNPLNDSDATLTAEVPPPLSFPEQARKGGGGGGGSDHLIIRLGPHASLPLLLPARVVPGRKTVRYMAGTAGHWEVKLEHAPLPPPPPQQQHTGAVPRRVLGLMAAETYAPPPMMARARSSPVGQLVDVESALFEDVSLGEEDEGGVGGDLGDDGDGPLMDATQLMHAAPTAFLCASCSLPLVQTSTLSSSSSSSSTTGSSSSPGSSPGRTIQGAPAPLKYLDLPSEHWEELVEAWMCHADQKLHSAAMHRGKVGFWPTEREVWVGGSYLLVHGARVVSGRIVCGGEAKGERKDGDGDEESWKLCRCLCGAVVGRSRERREEGTGDVSMCYRVLKYAVRPVVPNLNPANNTLLNIPLSAYVVADMLEFITAHGAHRFVIRDEETERVRILAWVFKPRMRLAYSVAANANARGAGGLLMKKSAAPVVAKVLYKIVGPNDAARDIKSVLNEYPGFPQAEYLAYPTATCHQLATLLKESTAAYPPGLRSMMDLSVGWLERR